jgi:hypothetical protein
MKMAVFWVVALCSLVDVYFYQSTRRYNPEDNPLCTHHRENLKSYILYMVYECAHSENSET